MWGGVYEKKRKSAACKGFKASNTFEESQVSFRTKMKRAFIDTVVNIRDVAPSRP